MLSQDIKILIETHLESALAIVEGEDGVHFNAIVISPAFIGKNRIQKQQMVYATIGEHIANGTIHAISLKTYTPEEWHQSNQEAL